MERDQALTPAPRGSSFGATLYIDQTLLGFSPPFHTLSDFALFRTGVGLPDYLKKLPGLGPASNPISNDWVDYARPNHYIGISQSASLMRPVAGEFCNSDDNLPSDGRVPIPMDYSTIRVNGNFVNGPSGP